jgi:hypothetical protein
MRKSRAVGVFPQHAEDRIAYEALEDVALAVQVLRRTHDTHPRPTSGGLWLPLSSRSRGAPSPGITSPVDLPHPMPQAPPGYKGDREWERDQRAAGEKAGLSPVYLRYISGIQIGLPYVYLRPLAQPSLPRARVACTAPCPPAVCGGVTRYVPRTAAGCAGAGGGAAALLRLQRQPRRLGRRGRQARGHHRCFARSRTEITRA